MGAPTPDAEALVALRQGRNWRNEPSMFLANAVVEDEHDVELVEGGSVSEPFLRVLGIHLGPEALRASDEENPFR